MTVLLGPNNAGKSILSTILYVIGRGIGAYSQTDEHDRLLGYIEEKSFDNTIYTFLQHENKRLQDLIELSLARVYAGVRTDLVRWNQKKMAATIRFKNLTVSIHADAGADGFKVHCRIPSKKKVIHDLRQLPSAKNLHQSSIVEVWHGPEPPTRLPITYYTVAPRLPRDIRRWLLAGTEGTIFRKPTYLLAERAGVVRIYRPVVAAYLRASLPNLIHSARRHQPQMRKVLDELGSSSLQLPVLTGDFLEDFLLGSRRPSEMNLTLTQIKQRAKILSALCDVMEGVVEVSENYEVTYRPYDGKVLDIASASSMVAEIAPFYEIIRSGVFESLIIEEPEAHLHVKKQYQLAKALSHLYDLDLGAFITTHSTTIPIALAHMTALARLKPAIVKELGYRPENAINPRDLNILWIHREAEGSIVEEVAVMSDGSLERVPEADDILLQLYKEEERIARALNSE